MGKCDGVPKGGSSFCDQRAQIQRAQIKLQPHNHEAEVITSRGQDSVAGITRGSNEVVATHPMLGLEMSDDGFDGGSAPRLKNRESGDLLHGHRRGAALKPLAEMRHQLIKLVQR
jgi:hypothetical protein